MGRHKSEVSSGELKSNLLWKQKSYDTKTTWRRNYSVCKCGEKIACDTKWCEASLYISTEEL
jgi:hypothetical protein